MRKYLLIGFLFAFVGVFGQTNDTTKYFKSVDYGWQYKRLKIDSIIIMPNGLVVNRAYRFISSTDTASMLGGYVRLPYLTSLLAYKVNYTDTASMLSPYYRSATAAANLALKVNYTDTASMLSPYYLKSNPSGYITSSAIAGKVNYTDTAAMLSAYYNKTATDAKVNLKVNISDTSAMLSPYARSINVPTLSTVVKYTDTASMLSGYVRTGNIPTSTSVVKYTDTAAMLSSYYNKTATDSKLALKVNISDTSSMLSPYARTISIPSLSSVVKYSDTSAMLTPYSKDYNTVHITGTEIISGLKTMRGVIIDSNTTFQKKYWSGTNLNTFKMGSGYELYGTAHASGGYHYYLSGGQSGYWNSGYDLIIGNNANMVASFGYDSGIELGLATKIDGDVTFKGGVMGTVNSSPYTGFKYAAASGWTYAIQDYAGDNKFTIDNNGLPKFKNANLLINAGTDSVATKAYARSISTDISGKVNYTDTATMLSAYYNKTATDAKLALDVKYTDTALMLSKYYNKTAADALLATKVPQSRTITINGTTLDLSADRSFSITAGVSSVVGNAPISVSTTSGVATLSISQATTSSNGFLSSTDWNTFNGKQSALSFSGPLVNSAGTIYLLTATSTQNGYLSAADWTTFNNKVSTSRTITINGTAYDLSADRSWTVSPNMNARTETSFTATAGQSAFTVAYTVGQVDVYYNGSKLAPSEFTASTGTGISLGFTCQANDIIDVVAYSTGSGIGGTGTSNYLSKFTASGTIGNSGIYEGTSGYVSIGNTNSTYNLDVTGTGRFTGALTLGTTTAPSYGSGSLGINAGLLSMQNVVGVQGSFQNNAYYNGTNWIGTSNSISYANAVRLIQDGSIQFHIGSVSTSGQTMSNWDGSDIKMKITSAGNVGIGTTTPAGKLEVSADQSTNNQHINIIGTQTSYNQGYSIGIPTSTKDLRFYDLTAGTERMRITSGGDVFIGFSSSSGNKFAVSANGSVPAIYINSSGGIGSYYFGTGAIYSNAGILTNTAPSDERLKENITDISWGLSDILKLRPVSYHWKNDRINQGVQFGFVAQEVQHVMPEAIKEFGEDVKYLGLEKDAIYATLVKAIQEQQKQIEELKAKIK